MKLGVKAYLLKVGFLFGKKPTKLDLSIHSSLSNEGKLAFERYCALPPQYKNIKDLLAIPQSSKQAARLFSSDAERYVASMKFINQIFDSLEAGKVLEMGCGAGFLIDFLSHKHPNFNFEGLEVQKNLADIASQFTGKNIYNMDYIYDGAVGKYDYLICEFGWDHSDIAEGVAPHDLQEIEGHQYCLGCCEVAQKSYENMLSKWDEWLLDNSKLIVLGRLGTIGHLKAFLNAANLYGMTLNSNLSNWIYWKAENQIKRVPALIFEKGLSKTSDEIIEDCVHLYRKANT